MTATRDPDHPPDPPVEQNEPVEPDPPDMTGEDQARPPADQPTDAVTSVTAEPDPAPAEPEGPEGPEENGHEVEGETTRASAAHTVAFPSPIPDYAMEPSAERHARARAADPLDTAPTRRHPDDAGLTVPLTVPRTLNPRHPLTPDPPDLTPDPPGLTPDPPGLSPEPPGLSPELPQLAPDPPYLPPGPPQLAPAPPYPVAPVRTSRAEPGYPEASARPRRRPLFGTIVWGVLLLALAGYVLLRVLLPTPADPTLWLLGGVIVIGLLLIVVGIIAALRRAG